MSFTKYALILLTFFTFACKQSDTSSNETAASTPVVKSSVPVTTSENKAVTAQASMRANATAAVQAPPSEDFPFTVELKDIEGKIHKSEDVFKKNGKPTVLMFWLTTCGPCHMKLNAIKPLYPQWKEEADFNLFAISGDFPKNYEKFVKQTKQKAWEWGTYNDVNRGFREILPGGLNGYPQTFIFDKNGKLVYQDKRYRPGDEHRLFAKIKEICNS